MKRAAAKRATASERAAAFERATASKRATALKRAAALGVVLAVAALAGCRVGPRYVQPSVPLAPGYKEAGPGASGQDKGWRPAQPGDAATRGEWWTLFADPELNALEPQVAAANQNLKVAEARFRQARAQIGINRASLSPTLGIAPFLGGLRSSANRPNANSANSNNGVADIQLPLDLDYEVDLWGRIHRGVSAAREEAQATAADLQNVLLGLQTELAVDYFEARSADAEKKLLDDTVKDYEDAFRITTNRFEGGVTSQADVDQARTQLQSARVQASDITLRRAQFEHAIAVLTGQPPDSFTLPVRPLNDRPPPIPPGLPSELLERRPDIAAAERRMAEANDRIGIARAAFFPTLSIHAAGGFEGSSLLNLFSGSSYLWAVGPALAQTLFDAGRRRAVSEQAQASYDATVAGYRQTALTAFQQVEDNLAVLRILGDEAEQQKQATQAARAAQQIFNNRYVGGVDTYLQVISSQTTALNNERNDIDIMRRQMDASVLLVKALGGGWTTAQLPKL